MTLSKPLRLGLAASFLFTAYSGIQCMHYHAKIKNDENYIAAEKFSEIGSLVNNAKTFLVAESPRLSQEMIKRANNRLGDFSVIDDYLREFKLSLQTPDYDYEHQFSKLEMVQDELNNVTRSYLSQSKTLENMNTLSIHWRDFTQALILSSLLALAISIYSAKKKKKNT